MAATDFEMTNRGLKNYGDIKTSYGHVVSVGESSAALGPHLWLWINGDDARISNDRGREMSVHLSLDQAEALRRQLDAAIGNHYQRAE